MGTRRALEIRTRAFYLPLLFRNDTF
jgi:hypothetical protein